MKYRIIQTTNEDVITHYDSMVDFKRGIVEVLKRNDVQSVVIRATTDETANYYVGVLASEILSGVSLYAITIAYNQNTRYTAIMSR